ncbi:MAG: 3-phosphoshikimate 1-carboxyvinyltransferase [Eubacteriales bacterium]|nr:3-phosphoshikimate 1-carboxyvinyltransferase [Eubacteriales bacterium]
MKFTKTTAPLRGELTVPGDKSISHRAVMFGALAQGTTEVTNFLQGADCLSTISCFCQLGIAIDNTPERILIHGKGLHGLTAPADILDTGNSGTTTRLISGILAGQPFASTLNGDASIQSRPMKRIIDPLTQMGADIVSLRGNGCAPLLINGNKFIETASPSSKDTMAALKGIHYRSPVASAQVKSSILLAGLYADDETSVTEPYVSRNHTELMLRGFGADIRTEGTTATILPHPKLHGDLISVPGDISSAAYFIAAALMVPGSELLIRNVGINPTRDGILRVVRDMGAKIMVLNETTNGGEPAADLLVKHSFLKGITIGGALIPTLIDELPVIAVLACLADGTTVIKDAQELKVKESNRIDVVVNHLQAMGAHIEATEDGMIIEGGYPLHGAVIDSHLDHRIAMSFTIASLMADGETEILGVDCVNISYPDFYKTLEALER